MAKSGPSFFRRGMSRIADNEQGSVKKYLLTLPILDFMQNPFLVNIPIIPLKPNNLLKVFLHDDLCIRYPYTFKIDFPFVAFIPFLGI
jgi:hypothetical protein